ncbi:hypothetical protein AUM81_17485 [Cronobacter sakazakii]|nr:hypothetical protein AUM81_17485 [Cronobacter sakazakii]
MWLMKTLLTSGCTNQRGAGQGICDLFLTQEGQRYLTNSIKVYPKEKTFVYVMLPFTELILLWITLGTILHVHFTKKLRKYIISEHDKALSYV